MSVFHIVKRHLGRGLGHKWLEIGAGAREQIPKVQNFVIPARLPNPAGTQPAVVSKTLMTLIPAFAGGCPAATHFRSDAKESKQRKATRAVGKCDRRAKKPRGSLRYSRAKAAAELALRIRFVIKGKVVAQSSDSPRRNLLRSLRCSATLNGNAKARSAVIYLFLESVCRKLSPSPREGKAGIGSNA